MGINSLPEDLPGQCIKILSSHGRLSTAIPGFVARTPQIQLAEAIANTIRNKTTLIAEAGTGTGKTFAYLVPVLLSKNKVLISTATKTLQDQLFQKDLPTLLRALGLGLRIHNLKGRSNYLCTYRTTLHAEEGRFISAQCAAEVLHVREKLPQLTQGERGELPEIAEDSPVWPYVTSTTDNCLGNECPNHDQCFLIKARKRALESDVVVINHHLFFADSRLKHEGFGELLPGVETIIFDEAHQLPEIATHFHGERVSTRQFRELLDDTLREWPILDLTNQPLKKVSIHLDRCLDDLLHSIASFEERIDWHRIRRHAPFQQAWKTFKECVDEWQSCFAEDLQHLPGLARCKTRLEQILQQLDLFFAEGPQHIFWVERFKYHAVFHATPCDIAQAFSALLKRQRAAYIFTSATLTLASSFACFSRSLGLDSSETLLLPSPFDFSQQALLYLPRNLPDPKDANYNRALFQKALPIIHACGGRCFFLFTSHQALKQMATFLAPVLPFPLLVQGEEAKPILLERFRQLGNAVLLGTATFWEGVDVKGEALSCVIIDKLPFASPADPVIRGKMAYLKAQGVSGFDALSLPNAVLALKQGVGRLIRDVSDKGVLMLADPRLTGRPYGKQVLESLPKVPKTREEAKVLLFISNLTLPHEPISD